MDKMKFESVNVTENNIEKIGALFPNCITETTENGKLKKAVNFDLLRQMLSGDVVEGDENYEFTWVGKKASIVEANKPIRKTLRPCKEESVNWDTTENLYIEGDNLEVLKLLQESYLGKVKMIYIDPPYNTGNDFIYNDDFKMNEEEYSDISGEFDEDGNRLFKNTKTNGRFHSDWCSMMYPRLMLARNLLSNDGVIFISIDEKEVGNLRKICDEVFGEKNFISNIIWQSRTSISNDDVISLNHNHTLIYSKEKTTLLFGGDPLDESEYINPDNDPRGLWKLVPLDANHAGGDTVYPIKNPKTGRDYYPPNGRIWCYNRESMQHLIDDGRIKFGMNDDSAPKRKLYYNERIEKGDKKTPSSILLDAGTTKDGTNEIMNLFDGEKVFDYPKSVELLKRLLQYGMPIGGIVLDFFSGSGTIAQSVIEYCNEKNIKCNFIAVQLQENFDEIEKSASSSEKKTIKNAIKFLDKINRPHYITEIGKERIRRAGDKIKSENPMTTENLDTGFRVLKLDTTNMTDVYYSPLEISQDMLLEQVENIKPDRTDLDLLFACLLEWGLPLNMPYIVNLLKSKTS